MEIGRGPAHGNKQALSLKAPSHLGVLDSRTGDGTGNDDSRANYILAAVYSLTRRSTSGPLRRHRTPGQVQQCSAHNTPREMAEILLDIMRGRF